MTYAEMLVWETEGRRGAAERGWLGETARLEEELRQREEWERYQATLEGHEEEQR